MQRTLCLSLLLTLLVACTPIQSVREPQATSAPSLGLHIDTTQPLGEISPLVFGSNYGPWVSLRPETLPLADAAGITLLRYPGGEWGDKNELKSFQIDQLVDLARRMGAEPYVCVRLPGGSPEKAAALVKYANIDKQYKIKFWSIGNEPSLYAGSEPGGGWVKDAVWDTELFNREWRIYAEAMRAVDPSIQLIGPEIHQWSNNPQITPRDPSGRDWMTEFLQANGDLVDIVGFHRYPFPNNQDNTPATLAEMRANGREWNQIIPALRQLIQATTGRDIPIGITEINSHWTSATARETTPDSFFNAIWWADVLGHMIQQRAEMVAQFLLVSGSENGFGLLGRYEPRPTYYVYQMYKHFGTTLLTSSSDDADVSITAALRADGMLTAMIVNLADGTKQLPLQGVTGLPQQVLLFDQTHSASEVAPETIVHTSDDDVNVTLPPQSITLLIFPTP